MSTLDAIFNLVSSRVPRGSFCDPFGGIGSVSSYFQSKGYNVWSGDVMKFPHFFQIAKLRFNQTFFLKLIKLLGLVSLEDIAEHLNELRPKHGWFVREYAQKRYFFTEHNARKIQACRREIKGWYQKEWITYEERAVLLASLINSMDKVANTAGTYYAYLKTWHRKALINFKFEFIQPTLGKNSGSSFCEPAESLLSRRHFNIVYLDPPYNERSYPHYYHLPETIAQESTPCVHGMSGIHSNISSMSEFNKVKLAKQALIDVIDKARFDLLVFHYADNGIINNQDIVNILSNFQGLDEYYIDSKGYTTKEMPRDIKHHIYMVQNA